MFNKTLLIDEDSSFINTVSANIKSALSTFVDTIFDYSNINLDNITNYNLYIIRLNEQTKETIKYLSNLDKLILILTNEDTKETRKEILSLSVTDYIITNSKSSATTVTMIVKRLDNNSHKTVLIVDDSKLSLMQLSMVLETQNLNYVQCSNGQEALDYLRRPNSKKIDLVITDYEMPIMNGYELLQNIRKKFHLEELPVLVISGTEDHFMISKFLKAEANDYISKPFMHEEFIARVTNSLSLVSMFSEIKNMTMTDYLTGLNNRIYFYDVGVNTLEISRRAQQPVALAMIDIDDFKKINDTYGHEAGDKALIHIAKSIKKVLRRSDIFVRFGGEEFVILLPNCPHEQAVNIMNKVCKLIEKSILILNDTTKISMTVSIGITSEINTIDNMLEIADKYMYTAKKTGKNRVYSEE